MSTWWSFGTTKKEPTSPIASHHVSPQPFKAMSTAFRRGVQYNMKIVIRGDVMTGKTTLFNRLQGSQFEEESYTSTPQIQVANIPWHYKDSNDIVKIEIWDVVDKAHNNNTKKESGIKLEHVASATTTSSTTTTAPPAATPTTTEKVTSEFALDASTVDVYRNAHAALFIFDTTKPWTFDYVNNALASVPDNVAILVLGNFVDKERVVTLEEIHATLYEHNKRRIDSGTIKPNLIRYAETSLKTGLGLKFIYDYLGVPFLQLMMETLRKQLELKANDILDLLETLDKDDDVPENMQRRRGQDNFDQPSEPHLAKQHEAMKLAWDEELNDIAADHESLAVDTIVNEDLQERHSATPPPPTAPVKLKKSKTSLVIPDMSPPIIDQFDTGSIEDDWFGDEPVQATNKHEFDQQHTVNNADNNKKKGSNDDDKSDDNDHDDDDDDIPGNPMVARDEDVASVEYYPETRQATTASYTSAANASGTANTHQRKACQEPAVMVVQEDESEYQEKEDTNETHFSTSQMKQLRSHMFPSPVFRSDLEDVWAKGPSSVASIQMIQSDSEDEDNIIRPAVHHTLDPPSFTDLAMGGYEEIGGANNENPWTDPAYDELGTNNDSPSTYYSQQRQVLDEIENSSTANAGVISAGKAATVNADPIADKKAKKKKKGKSAKTRNGQKSATKL